MCGVTDYDPKRDAEILFVRCTNEVGWVGRCVPGAFLALKLTN